MKMPVYRAVPQPSLAALVCHFAVYATWRVRRFQHATPALIVILIVVLLGQLGGQTTYHLVDGSTSASYIVDSQDLPAAFSISRIASSTRQTTPQPVPQTHIVHHIHSQLAPSLTVIALMLLLLIRLLYTRPYVRLPQLNTPPINPPPRFLSR